MGEPDPASDDPGLRAVAHLPRLLLAVSGACALSVAIALVTVATGGSAPSFTLLATAPATVLVGSGLWVAWKVRQG